jgi:RNA polymerase sigma-70 factor (sigma-E family)
MVFPGHTDGFTQFAESVQSTLHRQAWLLCGDPHEAEDLVQETLFKIYRRWWMLSRRGDLAGYARVALVRAFISERRRPRWRYERPVAALPDAAAADGLSEDRMALWAALALLAPWQRAVVVLRFWEDLSVSQVAAILGCTAGTVTSQTTRALRTLRAALTDER